MTDWFSQLVPVVQAALITGAVGLLTALVTAVGTATSVLLKTWLDRRTDHARLQRANADAYRQYAEPLTDAATLLYWRLREIYESRDGGFFLRSTDKGTRFEEYKVASTRYRIAALLGWFAALRRELRQFGASPDPSVSPMRDSILHVESALADGYHVETQKALALASYWGLRLDEDVARRAGRLVDIALNRGLHEAGVASARELSPTQAIALHAQIAHLWSEELHTEELPVERLEATRQAVTEALSVREAWLYRDWQHALGNLMVKTGDARDAYVLDYLSFCDLYEQGSSAEKALIRRIDEMVIDLDVAGDVVQDARIEQLRAVFFSLAKMILAFHGSEPNRSQTTQRTLDAIHETLEGRAVQPEISLPATRAQAGPNLN